MTTVDAPRLCAYCGRELPPTATPRRRFCSASCRGQSWNAANPAPDRVTAGTELWARHVRRHYHARPHKLLVGHPKAEPWFGDTCPDECPEPGPMRPMEPFWRDVPR